MASTKATTARTAAKAVTEAAKPATAAPVGIAALAKHLGTQPRTLRAFIRSLDLGVGLGSRYAWASMSDPQVKKISAAWRKAEKAGE